MSPGTKMEATYSLAIVTMLLLVALSGCIGFDGSPGDDPVTAQSRADTATLLSVRGDPIPATAATRALAEAGLSDPYLDTEPTGVVHEIDIWVDEKFRINPWGDREFIGFAFTTDPDEPGTIPGPEIRVTQGDTVRVNLHIEAGLFAGHTMHWHGVDVPWESDGVPFITQDVATAEEDMIHTYEFVAKQPGFYWYHCVVEFPVHVDHGMFGTLIVEPQDPAADLPFDREETLIFHDADSQYLQASSYALHRDPNPDRDDVPKNPMDLADSAKQQGRTAVDVVGFAAGETTGEYLTSQGPRDYFPMYSTQYKPHYDTFMINGKSYPDTEPVLIREGETLRLRLLNAAQNHKSIHLHGHHMLVTHNDGYPLPQPHWEDTIGLAPGERIDAYVMGTNPGIWSLHDHSGVPGSGTTVANDYSFPGGQTTHLVYENFDPPGQPPAPDPAGATSGDFAVYAPSYGNP